MTLYVCSKLTSKVFQCPSQTNALVTSIFNKHLCCIDVFLFIFYFLFFGSMNAYNGRQSYRLDHMMDRTEAYMGHLKTLFLIISFKTIDLVEIF